MADHAGADDRSSDDGIRLEVLFPAALPVDGWQRRHDRGDVPSDWPYGLDHLKTYAPRTTARTLPPLNGWRGRAGRFLPARAPGSRSRGRDVGVCWDENVAVAMTRLARRPEMYCGVIWLTDRTTPADAVAKTTLRSLGAMTAVWVLSSAQVQPLQELLGPAGPRVHHVRFGVDEQFFGAQPYPERPLVVSLGNDRHRDAETTLAALRLVKRRRPAVEVVLQSRSALTGGSEGVTVVDRMTHRQVRDVYGRASVVVVATRPNLHGSGMTVALEAMSSARPVVVTGSPGLDDYVDDGRTALVTPAGDAEALAEASLELLDDPSRARAMGLAGREDVEAGMTTRHLVRGLAGVVGLPSPREG